MNNGFIGKILVDLTEKKFTVKEMLSDSVSLYMKWRPGQRGELIKS